MLIASAGLCTQSEYMYCTKCRDILWWSVTVGGGVGDKVAAKYHGWIYMYIIRMYSTAHTPPASSWLWPMDIRHAYMRVLVYDSVRVWLIAMSWTDIEWYFGQTMQNIPINISRIQPKQLSNHC